MLWKSSEAAKGVVPHRTLRPDLTFLAGLRFGAANATLAGRTSWLPMCPLLAAFRERGIHREVGREAVILACLLEAEAATFLPSVVAAAWARAKTGNDVGVHVCDGLLIQLCNVLEDLEHVLRCVRVQMGTDGQKAGKAAKHNLMDVQVSVNRLKKAQSLWWQVDWQHQMRPSQLSQTEQSAILLSILCEVFPENVGKRVGDRWYAAGHRIRGSEVEAVSGESFAFLFNARPQQWPKKADAGMPAAFLYTYPHESPRGQGGCRNCQRLDTGPCWLYVRHSVRLAEA